MTAAPSPIARKVYPQCGDCRWAQRGPGCGFTSAGTPCGHPVERRRFQSDKAPERESPADRENQTGANVE